VDIVVNAGVGTPQSVLGEDVEKDFELEVNAFGLLRVANAFAKTLEANKGALVQMNSIASIKTFPPFDLLCLKSGVIFINTSIKNRIRTKRGYCTKCSGPVATAMADAAGFENPADTTVVSEELLMHLKQVIFTYFQMKWQSKLKQLIKVSPIML
jgi:short-subunit dehydrogenase